MIIRELFLDEIERTGEGNTAVVGWGRGMGHKGHMMLASSVITHAKELGGDPYFVVSRTFGPDDPLKPEEKLSIYRKVFPEQGHIFQTATDELPDLTKVLAHLNKQGYTNAVVVVGADQVKAFQYLNAYNGKPNKAGDIPFTFDNLNVISRQETSDPSREQEGPRATPMRQVLQDPSKSEQEQFAVWRDAMSPEISDDEVLDLMRKAKQRMQDMKPAPKKAPAKKKAAEPVAEAGYTDIFLGKEAIGQLVQDEDGMWEPIPYDQPWQGGDYLGLFKTRQEAAKALKLYYKNKESAATKRNDTFDKKSHQYKTTMKHADRPTVQQRMAAHDIKPGIKGYRDRADMLRDLERTGKLKTDIDESMIAKHFKGIMKRG